MILKARPLWLGQAGAGLLPTLPATTPPAPQFTPGPLPMPPTLPPEGYGDLDGTWFNPATGLVVSHNRNKQTSQDCDYQDTYDNWQKGTVWNPCDPSQEAGTISAIDFGAAPAPTPVPKPPVAVPPAVTPPPAQPPDNGAPIPTQNQAPGAVDQSGNPLPTQPEAQGPIPTHPLPRAYPPVAVYPPAAAPPAQAPPAQVPQQPPASGGATTALVAGGIGAAGILTAVLIGVFRK